MPRKTEALNPSAAAVPSRIELPCCRTAHPAPDHGNCLFGKPALPQRKRSVTLYPRAQPAGVAGGPPRPGCEQFSLVPPPHALSKSGGTRPRSPTSASPPRITACGIPPTRRSEPNVVLRVVQQQIPLSAKMELCNPRQPPLAGGQKTVELQCSRQHTNRHLARRLRQCPNRSKDIEDVLADLQHWSGETSEFKGNQ